MSSLLGLRMRIRARLFDMGFRVKYSGGPWDWRNRIKR